MWPFTSASQPSSGDKDVDAFLASARPSVPSGQSPRSTSPTKPPASSSVSGQSGHAREEARAPPPPRAQTPYQVPREQEHEAPWPSPAESMFDPTTARTAQRMASQEICSPMEAELRECLRNGPFWERRMTMCQAARSRFWECVRESKEALQVLQYSSPEETKKLRVVERYVEVRLRRLEGKPVEEAASVDGGGLGPTGRGDATRNGDEDDASPGSHFGAGGEQSDA